MTPIPFLPFLRIAAALLAVSVLTSPGRLAVAQDKPPANLSSVLGELRKGGYVIYFRHSATDDTTGLPDIESDLARCETQRNLSAKGREQAAEMGKALKALRIPIGSVSASPLCRAGNSAQLMFGKYTVNKDLYFVISADARESKRLTDSLRRMLSTPPAPGTNDVLVAHSANLREAAGIFAKPEGVAYVFRPLPDGKHEVVATIIPEEWSTAAKLKQ
jgi:phosphohistidine phosphatase SixA